MSSQADSLASLFPMPVNGGGSKTSAISGRKCLELLTKSGRLGLLVKMLLESEQWSSNAGLLTWEVKSLCSKRVVDFTDTQLNTPSPSNASALILNQRDIQSSRCLFRLVLSAHHIEGIESSSLLITPTAVMTCENPDNMRARAERKGYQNGTKFGSLESQVMYDPKVGSLLKTPCAMDACADKRKSKSVSGTSGTLAQEIASGYVRKRGLMLPTPLAVEVNHSRRVKDLKAKGAESFHSRLNGESRPNSIMDFLDFHELLPTPTAIEGEKYTNTYNPNSQMGKSLSAMAGSGMLSILGAERMALDQETDGKPFRLSPLFTEEMMGFPFLWTALPFIRTNGEQNHSKPTETP